MTQRIAAERAVRHKKKQITVAAICFSNRMCLVDYLSLNTRNLYQFVCFSFVIYRIKVKSK